MIQYINKKDIYGPFMARQEVYLPHSAEVTSDKYTNMSVEKILWKISSKQFTGGTRTSHQPSIIWMTS